MPFGCKSKAIILDVAVPRFLPPGRSSGLQAVWQKTTRFVFESMTLPEPMPKSLHDFHDISL